MAITNEMFAEGKHLPTVSKSNQIQEWQKVTQYLKDKLSGNYRKPIRILTNPKWFNVI